MEPLRRLCRNAAQGLARARSWYASQPRERRIYLGVVGCFLAALGLYLVFGAKPWVAGISVREATGKRLRTVDYLVSGVYWAALANFVFCLALLALNRWIIRPLPAPLPDETPAENGPSLRVFLIGLAAVMMLAAVFNYPRLGMSLWGDEEMTMREFVIGEALRDEATGKFQVEDLPWWKTVFEYRTTNNHILYSILGRLSHSVVGTPSAPDRPYFSETALRMPCYLAGLASVAAVGFLVRLAGFRRAALPAALIYALHPWFLRYGVEARGYALILFLEPFALIALLRGSLTGSWKWWMAYGVSQFLLFYAFPGTIYFLFLMNLAGLGAILLTSPRRWAEPGAARLALFTRFCVANLVTLMLFLQLFTPCITPFRIWLARDRAHGELGWEWLQDALSYLGFGFPWRAWEPGNPFTVTLSSLQSDHPILFAATLLLAVGFAALGAVRLMKSRSPARWFLLPIVLPLPMAYMHNTLTGNLMMHWYAVGSLPGLALLWGLGLEAPTRRLPRILAGPALAPALSLVMIAGFFAVTHAQRRILWHHPTEPIYESVRAMREIVNPLDPRIDEDVMTLGFHMYSVGYDPAVFRVSSRDYEIGGEGERVAVAEFKSALRESDATGRPLFINIAQVGYAALMLPKLVELLEDPKLFTEVAVFHGLQEPCTRRIFQYTPGSLPPEPALP